MWKGGDCLSVCACGRVVTAWECVHVGGWRLPECVCMWEGGNCMSVCMWEIGDCLRVCACGGVATA